MYEELEADYLARFREDVELPKAERRQRLIRDLVDAGPYQSDAPQPGAQLWLRLGLRRLGEQMIAAGEWLAQADGGRSGNPDWTGLP